MIEYRLMMSSGNFFLKTECYAAFENDKGIR